MTSSPSISVDGRKLAFLSNRSGNTDVWLRDMTSGKEIAVTATPGNESHPRLTREAPSCVMELLSAASRLSISLPPA